MPIQSQPSAFSSLVSTRATELRNIANVDALDAWIHELGRQLGGALPEDGADGKDSRAAKSRAWLSSVAKNWMLRQGSLVAYHPEPELLAVAPAWVRQAAASGRPIQQLALSEAELSKFQSILDWLTSDDGPPISSAWSKISVSQAEAAELSWIGRMAKAAAKRDLEASEAAGTSFFCEADSVGAPLRWVSVVSQDSLDREGALMRHCVGSYAKDVSANRKSIYSLRDQGNKPLLTIEARGSCLHQLKAFANSPCPPELMPAVQRFAATFAQLHDVGAIGASKEVQRAGLFPVPGLGFAVRGEAPPPSWTSRIDELLFQSSVEAPRSADNLLPPLAAAGFSSLVSQALPHSSSHAVSNATTLASKHGNLDVLEILLPFLSEAPPRDAILGAVDHGHFECAKRLLAAAEPSKEIGERALMFAIDRGFLDCATLLMPFAGSSSESFEPIVAAAAGRGRLDILSLVLSACVDLEPCLPRALIFAAARGNLDCIKLLLDQGPKGSSVREALLIAAGHDNVDAVKLLLLAAGPRCDTWEALNAAVAQGASLECASALFPQSHMRCGEDPDLGPLLYAIRDGRCDLLSAMLPLYGSSIHSCSVTLELALCSLQSTKADTLSLVLSHSGAALDARAIDSLKKSAQKANSSVAVDAIRSWLDVHEAANSPAAQIDVASALQSRRLDAPKPSSDTPLSAPGSLPRSLASEVLPPVPRSLRKRQSKALSKPKSTSTYLTKEP